MPAAERPCSRCADVSKRFAGLHAVDGATFDVAPRHDHRADRAERRRKVDALQRGDRLRARRRRRRLLRRRLGLRARRPHTIARARDGADVPADEGARRDVASSTTCCSRRGTPASASRSRRSGRLAGRRAAARDARSRAPRGLRARRQGEDYAGTLSGGQRKLLELARALMLEPRLLLLDEPLAGVNRTLGRRCSEHIERLRDERDVTILLVEHDMDVVMRYARHGRRDGRGPRAHGRARPTRCAATRA